MDYILLIAIRIVIKTMADVKGWYTLVSRWTDIESSVLEAGKMSKYKNLSNFDEDQIMMAVYIIIKCVFIVACLLQFIHLTLLTTAA